MGILDKLIPKNTNIFGATTPTYLNAVATDDQIKTAQNQSLFQGLLGTALGYLAQPKNQNYGSAVPYLAKSYMQGMQMAQSPYDRLERDVVMKEKFDQMALEKQRQADLKTLQENMYTTIPAETFTQSTYQPINQIGPGGERAIAPSYAPSTTEEIVLTPAQKVLNQEKLMEYAIKYPDKGGQFVDVITKLDALNRPQGTRQLSVEEKLKRKLPLSIEYQINKEGTVSPIGGTEQKPVDVGVERNSRAVAEINPNTGLPYESFLQLPVELRNKINKDIDIAKENNAKFMGGVELTKQSKNDVQTALLQTTDRKRRLNRIIDSFNPEFLTAQGKIKSGTLSFLEKWGMKDLSPEEIEYQEQYTNFMKDSYAEMNQYIKDITGAALSEFEAERIRKAIPDPEKDSPTVFKRGMERAYEELQIAEARLAYLNSKGLGSVRELSLDDFTGMIQETGEQTSNLLIKSPLYNPKKYKSLNEIKSKDPINYDKIMKQVNISIAAKFGLPNY